MKRLLTIVATICLTGLMSNSGQAQYADCFNHAQACTTPAFPVFGNSGFGTVDELAGNNISNPGTNPNPVPGNWGCLLAGELNSTWIVITVSSTGTLEFSIGAGGGGCIDWAMWPYNSTACADIAGNALPPVACNWNGACGGITGMAMPGNIPPPGVQADFETGLNVNPGDQFVLMFSNWSGQTTTFPLNFFGSAAVTCGLQDQTICEGDTAILDATYLGSNGSTYAWDPNAAIVGSTASQDSVWVSPTTTDIFIVHVTDSLGNVTDDTATVTVIPTIVPTISITNDNCLTTPSGQLNITITGGSPPIEYQITGPVSDQNQTGVFTGLPQGVYDVTIFPTNYTACSVTQQVTVGWECGIIDTTICEGDTAVLFVEGYAGWTKTWDAEPTLWTNAPANDTGWVNPTTTTTYVVHIDDGMGTIVDDTAVVTVVPNITLDLQITDNTCLNTPNGILDMTGTTVQPLDFTINGPVNSTNSTGMFTDLPEGTYTITIAQTGYSISCPITFDTTIAYIPPDTVYLVGDTAVCLGDTIHLELIGASGYDINWSFGGETTESVDIFTLTSTPLTVTINTGCEIITINTTLIIYPLPIADAGLDTSVAVEDWVQLDGAGGQFYLWSPTTGLDCYTCENPNASPLVTTTYTMTAIDANGCRSTDFVTVEVIYLPIYIPTGFSPNGDGENDILYVRGAGMTSMNFIIYDRWGNAVFTTQDKTIGWDGTYKDKPVNMGTYGWQFSATRGNGEIIELKGNVTLLR